MNREKVRKTSFDYLANSDYKNAFSTMKLLADLPNPLIDDVYLAAQFAFENENFEQAMNYLNQSIKLAEKQKENYYLNSALMLRSYLFYTQRKYDAAKKDILQVATDCDMAWVLGLKVNTQKTLSEAIEKEIKKP